MAQKQLPAQQSYISLNGEYITPDTQTRGNLLVVGIGAVAIVAFALIIVLLIFWAVLAPIILWGGILVFGAAFLSVCTVGFIKAKGNYDHNKIQGRIIGLEIDHKQEEVNKARYEADTQKWLAMQEELQAEHMRRRLDYVTIDSKQALYHIGSGAMAYIPPTKEERNLLTAGEQAGDTLHFSDIVHRLNTALVIGGQDSGKSTLLQWIAYHRQGQTISLDPHHGRWPVDLRIGQGRDYQSIEAMLAKVYATMDKRYKTGQNSPAINIIIDEWMSIVDNCPTAARHIKTLLTEGRKAGVFMFVGSHTDRARPIGLDGAADLKEGMALVYLKWNPRDNQRSAEIVLHRDRYELVTPGPFTEPTDTVRVWVASEPIEQVKLCEVCNEPLTGRQERFCGNQCKDAWHNARR